MPWLSRRAQPPASVMQQLDRDERVVSFADVEGGVVVATPRGLWWPFPGGMRRIGWERVDKAVWDDGRLTVIEADLIDDLLLVDRPPISARVVTPRDLPPTVRKRVESSVVRSEVYPVPGGSGPFRRPSHPRPGRRCLVGSPRSGNPGHRGGPRRDYRTY